MSGTQKAKHNKAVWACGLRLRRNRDDAQLNFFTGFESDRIRTRVILLGMVSLTALRQHPRFARFFEVVHPFFWPVIWWTLNAVFRAYDASNRTEFLLGITWWGQVYVAFGGDQRPDPLTDKPMTRSFRHLTDESWASSLPTNLEGLSPFDELMTFPDGPVLRILWRSRKGAMTSPQPDSSWFPLIPAKAGTQ